MWIYEHGEPADDPALRRPLDLLGSADARALHPEDYDTVTLERRFRELTTATGASARDLAWFDMALTVGLLRHISDVHIGRVNPRNLSVGINVQPKKLDLARAKKPRERFGARIPPAR
ncbi:MAG: hypothetical protein ACJ79A_04860 [Gemmatimonadaceae bacterium]